MANIEIFTSEMNLYNLELVSIEDNCSTFSQVLPITAETKEIQKNCLYVGSCSQISALKFRPKKGIFLLMEDTTTIPADFINSNTIIISRYAQNTDFLFFQARQWLANHMAYLENSNSLFQIFLNQKEDLLSHLINHAAKLLGNPIVLLDANFRILTGSVSNPVDDPIWQQNLSRGYCSYEQNMEIKGFLETDRSLDVEDLLIVNSKFSASRICLRKLRVKREHIGHLLIFESTSPFSKMNKKLFFLLADLATTAIYNSYEKAQILNEFDEDYIFIECLSGKLRSYGSFLDRIRNTIFATPSTYHVIIIDVAHFENFDPKKEILRNYFSKLFKRSWMLWFKGNVVAIVDMDGCNNLSLTLKTGIPFFEEKSLRMAISDSFQNIFYIEKYYRQALITEQFSKRLHPQVMFSYYNEYKFYDLINSAFPSSNLKEYFDSRLLAILEYDQKNNTEYYETVYQFIFCGQNLSKTSSILHVHKNTVSYRISKARQLFNLDLDNVDEVFCLMYSYKIQKLIDLIPDEEKRAASEQATLFPYTILC